MSEDSLQANSLFRFVLGTASEAEQLRIEEECFSDPARQQELWVVFDEVAERFWQGGLTPAEAQQFAVRLRASPLLAERANHLRALLAVLPPDTAKPAPVPTASFSGFRWPKLAWWQGGLAATALLLAILGITWWQRKSSGPEPIVRQESPSLSPTAVFSPPQPTLNPLPSVAPRSQATPMAKPPSSAVTLATFFLLSRTVRDLSDVVPLPVAPPTQTLALQMEVRKPLYARYRVTVQASDGTVRTISNLHPRPYQGRWVLTIQVPVAAVAVEPFTVQINGVLSPQESVLTGTHVLQVQRK